MGGCSEETEQPSLLIFTKTEGYRHESIEHGVETITKLASEQGFKVVHTEDAFLFDEDFLEDIHTVLFLNTTGDVLNYQQQADFKRFIQAGGGFIGIHAAADTEYKWEWYGQLVGGYFNGHPSDPNVREARVYKNEGHDIIDETPDDWVREDEWYDYRDMNPQIKVLQYVDEKSYGGGNMGETHPITWLHAFDGGKAFYTGMGHTLATYDDPLFQSIIENALLEVTPDKLDFSKVTAARVPDEDRFTKTVLAFNLNEPTELAVLPDNKVIFIERKGAVKMYDPNQDSTFLINTIDVFSEEEDGLMGLALDPDFIDNNWVYLYYSPIGNQAINRLSRFDFYNDRLMPSTEQVILEVPVQREECCHTGGSLTFDSSGNLYLSTGDNTNPFASDGFGPMDEREGRSAWDAQRSSANTNDLRGKILRIHPEADGTYTIPDGNLFPPGTPDTKPEIYVMGARNPYRISVDSRRNRLFWGDVGPDAGEQDSLRGPRGYDELNMASEAGFYGWPLFVGNNFAYRDYNFASNTSGDYFDVKNPVNNSPNNTGKRQLPAAQPALIYYPYANSPEFPMLKTGGRNAMAGPVYYADDYPNAEQNFSTYYDGKLLAYDWMRNWIYAVTINSDDELESMEPFMPNTKFNNLMDMTFSQDGQLYLLEYGSGWFQRNIDARLVRIDYNPGNRNPVIKPGEKQHIGQVPLAVNISAADTKDPDGDPLKYTWYIDKDKITTGETFDHTFEKKGIYLVTLKVEDDHGGEALQDYIVRAGNAAPEVAINVQGNSTFYFDGRDVPYIVTVSDKEDGSTTKGGISDKDVQVFHDFLERGFDMTELAQGHQKPSTIALGQQIIESSDCKSCHKVEGKSIGPSYQQVAERYTDDPNAISYLSKKIISGGAGNWGEVAMSAHPGISNTEASQIVEFIMSLADGYEVDLKPLSGTLTTDKHKSNNTEGMYMITALYKDRGNEFGRLQSTGQLMLRHHKIKAHRYNDAGMTKAVGREDRGQDIEMKDGSWLVFQDIDLTGIDRLMIKGYKESSALSGGKVIIKRDGLEGSIIGEADIPANSDDLMMPISIKAVSEPVDIYIIYQNEGEKDETVTLEWIDFQIDKQKTLTSIN